MDSKGRAACRHRRHAPHERLVTAVDDELAVFFDVGRPCQEAGYLFYGLQKLVCRVGLLAYLPWATDVLQGWNQRVPYRTRKPVPAISV